MDNLYQWPGSLRYTRTEFCRNIEIFILLVRILRFFILHFPHFENTEHTKFQLNSYIILRDINIKMKLKNNILTTSKPTEFKFCIISLSNIYSKFTVRLGRR